MIQSMTGYGKAEINLNKTNLTIEVKSLNSKQIDINVKMPSCYRDREIGLRNLLSEKIQRGKIELLIWRANTESFSNYTLNNKAIKNYHQQILSLKKDLGLKRNFWTFTPFLAQSTDIIPTLLKIPNALIKEPNEGDENEWSIIEKGVVAAVNDLLNFRLAEGKKLEKDIELRIQNIDKLLNEILPFEKERIQKVKKKLHEKLLDIDIPNIDEIRFEQEILYYLEKQDITEEKVRLSAHLNYFTESLNSISPNGKKLGFIAQEIGREINTIGSKSSNANMQKIVVQMKDELEKIKEQLLNIL